MANIINWPEGLPFLDMGWNYKPGDNILRSSMERGPVKTRRKTTAKTDGYTGSMDLTSPQLDIFINFVENTLRDCSLHFLYPNWIKDTASFMRIRSYSIQQKSQVLYSVSLELEVLP